MTTIPSDDPQLTFVYRFFNADEELLYVGIAKDLKARFRQHSKTKDWWHEVERSSAEQHRTLALALAAEATAILSESPKYNLAIPSLKRHDTLQERAALDPVLSLPLMERLRVAENDGRRLANARAEIDGLSSRLETALKDLEFEKEASFTARADVAKLTRAVRDISSMHADTTNNLQWHKQQLTFVLTQLAEAQASLAAKDPQPTRPRSFFIPRFWSAA